MPNGQTDIFKIRKETLVTMLKGLGEAPLRCMKIGEHDWEEYSSDSIIDLVRALPESPLGVEELYGEVYWVHVWAEDKYLVEIGTDASIYNELHEYHIGQRE